MITTQEVGISEVIFEQKLFSLSNLKNMKNMFKKKYFMIYINIKY